MSTGLKSVRHVVVDSPIGELTIVRDGGCFTGLYFPHHWTRPDASRFGPRVDATEDRSFDDMIAQLGEYFAGTRQEFELPLDPQGRQTARRVWRFIAGIPYGRTTTYGALVAKLGGDVDARTVGGFVGQNPLSIIIPCHRVVGADGSLTGYAGGLARKRHLLDLEQAGSAQTLW